MRVRVDDIIVGCSEEGVRDAPALIFIHGFPFNRSMWKVQMEALSEDWRVISYDVRGHGETDSGQKPFSIRLFAQDLIALMDTLEIEKAVLCGLSMGGYIALNAVLTHPNRFKALILSDTQCAADTPEAKGKRLKAIETIRKGGVEIFADANLPNFFAAESLQSLESTVEHVRMMMAATSEATLIDTLRALYEREESCSRLQEISVPVLIMVGENDKITPPTASELMHQMINGSHLGVISQAGHLSNMERPIEFNNALAIFLGSLR